ncbi:hypothetical protein P280DRAFT_207553 [Massarina eburnea CBS 473.64]|uniref:Uncharacterized protein n=1 Tax=Massarina eburnea CBS 473.64 TaxID=1395130 RepID=A0A6A6RII4_9PLEO|nr:hypothetical protein P280DRAFT_207553 [Massarina eburnea CBS 473.64]
MGNGVRLPSPPPLVSSRQPYETRTPRLPLLVTNCRLSPTQSNHILFRPKLQPIATPWLTDFHAGVREFHVRGGSSRALPPPRLQIIVIPELVLRGLCPLTASGIISPPGDGGEGGVAEVRGWVPDRKRYFGSRGGEMNGSELLILHGQGRHCGGLNLVLVGEVVLC